MKLFRSKSCALKGKNGKTQQKQGELSSQRRFSLQQLKNRSKSKSQKQKAYMKVFKEKILNYIQTRSDIEIINFYNQYKEEFFRKSINLQNLLYQKPQIRHKYLSEENQHFFKGFQQTLLNLFRRKTIVPGEFKNLRMQSVEEIEKWVFSWIQRQIIYEKAIEQQRQAINQNMFLLDEIKQFNQKVQSQPPIF